MHIDKISDMIAHFIGLFDTMAEEARLRNNYSEGPARSGPEQLPEEEAARLLDKNYDVALQDYDPGVKYHAGYYDFDYLPPHFARSSLRIRYQSIFPLRISAFQVAFPSRTNVSW